MAGELLRVRNNMQYNIGIKLLSGAERNITPGGFTMLTADDIEYVNSLSVPGKRPFTTGRLSVETDIETKETLDGILEVDIEGNERFEHSDEIEKKLKGNFPAMKKWLASITSPDFLYEIVEIAKKLDLTASRIRAIQDVAPYADLI